MSAERVEAPTEQSAATDDAQARQSAEKLVAGRNANLGELMLAASHAVRAGQPAAAMILLDGAGRFLHNPDAGLMRNFIEEMVTLLGICWREKMNEPALRAIELVLEILAEPLPAGAVELAPAVAGFTQRAGRFALLRREDDLFAGIAAQSSSWLAKACGGNSAGLMQPVIEAWLYRLVKHDRVTALAAVFSAMQTLMAAETDKTALLGNFLQEWRVAASTASLKPNNPLAVQLMEQLLLFALQSDNRDFWPPIVQTSGEAAALTVARHGARDGFFAVRPLLDVGRVMLGDELKLGSSEEPSNLRQLILYLVCDQAIRIANLAARRDMGAVAGDKIEEMYGKWMGMPDQEQHRRSVCRFFQVLLIIWSHKFRRAAKRWTPRENELSEPLLLSEEDQAKLTFLL